MWLTVQFECKVQSRCFENEIILFISFAVTKCQQSWWDDWVSRRHCLSSSKLFLLHQDKSDFDETWYEWYDGKGLQSYTAGFECLRKLCWLGQKGPQNMTKLFQPTGCSSQLFYCWTSSPATCWLLWVSEQICLVILHCLTLVMSHCMSIYILHFIFTTLHYLLM